MRHLRLLAIMVLLAAQMGGCNDIVRIDEQHEVQIGRDAAGKLEAQYGVWDNASQVFVL